MMMTPANLLLFLFAASLLPAAFPSTTVCSGTYKMMITASFVDIYETYYSTSLPMAVVATSDGGGIFAARLNADGNMRLVKTDALGTFQWLSELRAVGDPGNGVYWPRAMVEDQTEGYTYLCGYCGVSGYMFKYKTRDGTYQNSIIYTQGDSSYLHTLFVDSSGNLLFGGSYSLLSVSYYWIGVVNKSTLSLTMKSISFSASSITVFGIIEDTSVGNYIICGGTTTSSYLWVGAVSTSGWAKQWEYSVAGCSAVSKCDMVMLSSGSYAVLSNGNYYVANSAGVTLVTTSFTGAQAMTPSSESGTVTILGYTGGYSFGFYYDYVNDCEYTNSNTGKHSGDYVGAASKHASYAYAWSVGYLYTAPRMAILMKFEVVAALSCTGSQKSYFNRQCYTLLSSGCYGLCATCFMANNLEACYAGTGSLYLSGAMALFSARCDTDAYHYNAATNACETTTRTSCYVLCGGECLSSNTNKCAHHCRGVLVEPYIDSTGLYNNVCGCLGGRTVSTYTSRCVYTSGCYVLCSNGECGLTGDNTKCISCVSSASVQSTAAGAFTQCDCASGYVLSGSVCLACHPLCQECTLPNDATACKACVSGTGVVTTGSSSPYTCSCAAGYSLSGGQCTSCYPLCNGCTAQNDNTACSACVVGTNIVSTGSSAPYTCACASGTVLSSGQCLSCYALCNGCSLPYDSTACTACVSGANVVTTGSAAPYTCACAAGYTMSGTSCLACHPLCQECTSPGDHTACKACVAGTNVVTTGGSVPYTCSCASGYVLSGLRCLACHALCNECTLPNNPAACQACISASHVVTTGSSSPYTCSCASGYVLFGGLCLACHPLCQDCTLPSDQTACRSCVSSSNVLTTGSAVPYTCTCAVGTVISGSQCLACYPLCQGCSSPNDPTACTSCVSSASVVTIGSTSPYTCSCAVGTALSGSQCLPCHALCIGCISPNDQTACSACVSNANVITAGTSAPFTCSCATGTIASGSQCVMQCHALCSGCIASNDNTACLACAAVVGIAKSMSASGLAYTCQCPANTVYMSPGACVYTTGCHPLCSGMCLAQSDSSYCFSSCAAGATGSPNGAALRCVCDSGFIYLDSECKPILTTDCYPLCGSGCTQIDNQAHCVDCVQGQRNVVQTSGDPYTCSCAAGTELVDSVCAYTSGCGEYCNGMCTVQHSDEACLGCVAGMIGIVGNDTVNVTCGCANGTAYYNGSCVKEMDSGCSRLCGGGCVAADDAAKCVGQCVDSENVVKSGDQDGDDIVTCACANGTHINSRSQCVPDIDCGPLCDSCLDDDTCLACPVDSSPSMTLADGKCICSVSEGYVLFTSSDGAAICILKAQSESSAIRTAGDVLGSIIIVGSVLMGGCGCMIYVCVQTSSGILEIHGIGTRDRAAGSGQHEAHHIRACIGVPVRGIRELQHVRPAGVAAAQGLARRDRLQRPFRQLPVSSLYLFAVAVAS